MRDESGPEEWAVRLAEVLWSEKKCVVMEVIAHVIERHDYHDEAAQYVN